MELQRPSSDALHYAFEELLKKKLTLIFTEPALFF